MNSGSFDPPAWLANAHTQSILASSPWRRVRVRRRATQLLASQRSEIITVLDDVRLKVEISEPSRPRALAVLLHGWEGHSESNYVVETGARLLDLGLVVARVNFRDHGQTQHLNHGVFHSCRIDEIVAATELLASRWQLPMVLAGYSLGGNFALRVGLRARCALEHIFAVSPVINPSAGLHAIENSLFIYEKYFMKKWLRSIRAKCELYPDAYQWDPAFERARLRELTAWLVDRYTPFASLEEYLDGYAVGGDRLRDLRPPATILTAADDPVIPVADFHTLRLAATTRLVITERGGHCGFLPDLSLASWAAEQIAAHVAQDVLGDCPERFGSSLQGVG